MFWIVLLIYLLVSTIIYFVVDGFYFTNEARKTQKHNQMLRLEFASNKKDKVYRGVYEGLVTFKEKQHFHFQFSGILVGENRYLDIYYPADENEMPFVIESEQELKGDVAYALLNPYGYYSGNNISYDLIFKHDSLQHPQKFFEAIQENIADAPDRIFVTAITPISGDVQVQLMEWTKENDTTYKAQKYPDGKYAWESKGYCKIRQVERKTSGGGVKLAIAAIADIITAIIQGILIVIYLVFVLIMGGPVK